MLPLERAYKSFSGFFFVNLCSTSIVFKLNIAININIIDTNFLIYKNLIFLRYEINKRNPIKIYIKCLRKSWRKSNDVFELHKFYFQIHDTATLR